MLDGHGDDLHRYPVRLRANFSSNVLRDPQATVALQRHLAEKLEAISHYPEPVAESLASRLAERSGVERENLLVTNGAVAAIHLLAQTFRRSTSCILPPTFSEYEDAARIHEHQLRFAPWSALRDGLPEVVDVIWICNPNNPTGEVMSPTDLLAVVDASPDRLHIVDAAYEHACAMPAMDASAAAARSNLLLIGSLTKRFGIPGLRLGYVLGARRLMDRVRAGVGPWSVNSLAIEAGLYLIEHDKPGACPGIEPLQRAQELRRAISDIPGFRPRESATPFFLVECALPCATELKAWLVEKHGLLVRDASNFRGLDDRFIRIAVQEPRENAWLLDALREWSRR